MFNVPGVKTALSVFGAVNRNPERCIELLDKGNKQFHILKKTWF